MEREDNITKDAGGAWHEVKEHREREREQAQENYPARAPRCSSRIPLAQSGAAPSPPENDY